MGKENELSAIDAIYKILEKVDRIEKLIINTDNNVKLANNKIAKLQKKIDELSIAPKKVAYAVVPGELPSKNIKVYGFIKNSQKKPIDNVIVNIYDEVGNAIKKTETNPSGYWSLILEPGKYGVEYIHQKFKPINKVILITEDMEDYEVGK